MASSLRFAPDGRFRIVQFTDTHFWDGAQRDARTRRLMRRVLAAEQPALVVLTGDVLEGSRCADARQELERAVAPMVERGIPWAAVLGNHDDEGAADRRALLRILRRLPLCLT